jgi:hypothetical protein
VTVYYCKVDVEHCLLHAPSRVTRSDVTITLTLFYFQTDSGSSSGMHGGGERVADSQKQQQQKEQQQQQQEQRSRSQTSLKSQRAAQGDTEGGKYRPEVLSALLATTDRIVQEIDSVE